MSKPVTIAATDETGLTVISAAMQDAIIPVGSLKFDKSAQTFFLAATRFAHEATSAQRKLSALKIFNVLSAQFRGISRTRPDAFLVLLSISHDKLGPDEPERLDLNFAGDGTIRLSVDAVEALMTDTGVDRPTNKTPDHGHV